MRTATIGLAVGLVISFTATSQASTGPIGDHKPGSVDKSAPVLTHTGEPGNMVIARRDRGSDDRLGDDHGQNHGGKGKGGKGRGGHDDGPNHDRDDDRGHDGPNHA